MRGKSREIRAMNVGAHATWRKGRRVQWLAKIFPPVPEKSSRGPATLHRTSSTKPCHIFRNGRIFKRGAARARGCPHDLSGGNALCNHATGTHNSPVGHPHTRQQNNSVSNPYIVPDTLGFSRCQTKKDSSVAASFSARDHSAPTCR